MIRRFIRRSIGTGIGLGLLAGAAVAAGLPTRIGQGTQTKVAEVTSRLEGAPDSGSAIVYANGGVQVSYDRIRGIEKSRRGDRIKLCLIFVPSDCPPGDDRGRIYRATNLRTHAVWEAPDSAHSCGGA